MSVEIRIDDDVYTPKDIKVLIDYLARYINNQPSGGCSSCAFYDREEWELPCSKCQRNAKDYYRRASDE